MPRTPGPEISGSGPEAKKAKAAFARGLIERGEAVPADANGKLSAGVTHEIVGRAGRPILKRRRFSTV